MSRAELCVQACEGISDEALRAGGLRLALRVAKAALGLATQAEFIDLDLVTRTVEDLPASEPADIQT